MSIEENNAKMIEEEEDLLSLTDIEEARKSIGNSVKLTPLVRSEAFTKVLNGSKLYFKMESLQRTGSFKV
jgi:threonine dehydratase